ncbi:hypothetical protein RHGRI_008044 [Rhododendron griersonianum]|uniref:Uncharacterized protein n=1 Tax=Rhododendron griersonianum TaxID=479676 RepID=A0AAV6KZZ9_9ERIC|nr:hypothetical protein RHGRI_008044 [Rhododendron griersonianum]
MSMLAKLFHKPTESPQGSVTSKDLDPRVAVHCGIPSTASILAFDPIQRLLAIGTLDGRIKVIGGDNIEGLLFSGKPVPFKYLKVCEPDAQDLCLFLENQGFLVSVSNENEVQVWDLEHRCIVSNLQWESNITAFSVIYGTNYMYVGDEFGFLSILKYDAEKGELLQLPYHIPANLISEATGISSPNEQSVVGVLSQPCSLGNRQDREYLNTFLIYFLSFATMDNFLHSLKNKLICDGQHSKPWGISGVINMDGCKQQQSRVGPTENYIIAKSNQLVIMILSKSSYRVLIAYENGLIVLWDITEDRAVLVRGNKDLQLKSDEVVDFPKNASLEQFTDTLDHEQAEKEISSLCWVSSDGSILAVGYVDGDILLWNMSTAAPRKDKQGQKASNVIKLQLSSSDRRLPVIILHCSENILHTHCGGQLFVYGGDEIGSEEVLTILNLDWSSGIESLKCVGRVDLTLNGSFADMILVPNATATEGYGISSLFVLSNPGQLHFYDDSCLSSLMSQPEKKHSVPAVQYPEVIPTVEPYMTVGKLSLSEIVSEAQHRVARTATTPSSKWPLTGGVPSQLSFAEGDIIKRIYIAGYQDGSVCIWDATFPVLSCIFVLGSEIEGIEVAGTNASVSALDFLSSTSSLAIGNEYGLVRLYKLTGNSDKPSLHFVTETKREVHDFHCNSGAQCTAIFSILNSPVHTLQYMNSGDRLAVGFECGRVTMLDIRSLAVLFLTDCLSNSNSLAISLAMPTFPIACGNLDHSGNKTSIESAVEVIFILTRDARIVVLDSTTGNMISSLSMHSTELSAISIYILGK